MICLDTNAVIAAINARAPSVRMRLEQALTERLVVGISIVVWFELHYGAMKSARVRENRTTLAAFLALDVTIWPFDADDAEEAGDIRVTLERAGTPIGPYDILIAAQARRRGAILVTSNGREFARVPGLRLEDWASPA
jgi:tRNA(fMet)-specific endonuclease VapC